MKTREVSAASLFRGPDEMAQRMREFDWAATSAGPVESWPQGLRATVRTILGSRYPMILLWGEEDLLQIYNDAYTGLIGAKHPYALGRSIKETQAESWDTIGPMIRQVMTTGVPNWVPAQLLAVNRAGYNEEAYFSLSYSAVEDDQGVIRGMLCVCSEVTAQVVAERRLKLQRDLAAKAGETRSTEAACADIAAAIAVHPLDVPFAFAYLHQAPGMLTRAITVGVGPDSGLPPELVSLDGPLRNDVWPLGRIAAGEVVVLDDVTSRGGHLVGGPWNEAVHTALALPIPGAGGAPPLGALVFGVNPNRALDEAYRSFYELLAGQISTAIRNTQAHEEERRRSDALAELDRAKTQFFSNVSHEFRTPLTLMLGPLEDLLARREILPDMRDELGVAHRNALRLLRLVNTLLDFSRVEAGRAGANFEEVDLARFTRDLASTFRSSVEKAGLSLDVDCPPLAETVQIDRDMWEKIVLNLLSNSLKHTFAGRIAVSLRASGDRTVQLTISDTGIGIAPDQIGRIFERFYRIEGTRSRTYEGSGIGLALVRELVGLHGGSVTAESEPDRGTTFTITIPTRQAAAPEQIGQWRQPGITAIGAQPFVEEALRWSSDVAAAPVASPAPRENMADVPAVPAKARIVLADDNADMRAYVERLLLPEHDVIAVADGEAALKALRAGTADLLLTDVMMPVMDGFQLLRAVRDDPALRTLPVIMLSARAGDEASSLGLDAGADDYLMKPFSARELRARVNSHVKLARLRRELDEKDHQTRKMEAIGQLTGGIAHDFNNLLAVVVGSLDLALRRVEGDERVIRLMQNAMQAAERGAKLTSQLLAFSRRQRLEVAPADLNKIISGMDDLLHRTLGGKVEVVSRLGDDLWPALVDANQLELALLNLAINARDAMPAGGEIVIATSNAASGIQLSEHVRTDRNYVLVEVRDTGIGMPADVLSRVFEPFFTTKAVGKGTGLGLAQVYGTVKQQGGEVTVESQVGDGTIFRLYLPCAPLEHSVADADTTASDQEPDPERIAILLVDDDLDVRTTAAYMLEELGHRVVAVDSGREALRRIESGESFDLLLADYAMPGMTGVELATRAETIDPALKVLISTGYADRSVLPDGARTVLRKPFGLADLRHALGTVLTPA